MDKPLHDRVEHIETRMDLVAFIEDLHKDCLRNGVSWENHDLASYLGALASWTEDMEGAYRNRGLELPAVPSWKTFAEILLAATIYE